jgi:hypothetical protein
LNTKCTFITDNIFGQAVEKSLTFKLVKTLHCLAMGKTYRPLKKKGGTCAVDQEKEDALRDHS